MNQATYVWGDQLEQEGKLPANIWDVKKQAFPVVNPVISPKAGGAAGTTAVGSFPQNGYGLYDMTGNAWQWAADWYRKDYFVGNSLVLRTLVRRLAYQSKSK